jgi:arylsulfatase A-like enzyme
MKPVLWTKVLGLATGLGVLTMLVSDALGAAVGSDARPNFVVVMVDDMGYAGLSCFGNPHFETPELDRLAGEGMRLVDFHSSGTVCSPTRAGLLTGRYQQRTGIEAVIHPAIDHPEHRKGLQTSETTFAESLRQAGYATGLIGKWHLGYTEVLPAYHPQNHGFDTFIGYHSGNIDFISHIGDHNRHDWWHGREETVEEGYTTHLINRYAIDFIRRQAAADRPFCLYIAHEAIHNPVQVPGDPVRRTAERWDRWKWQEVSEKQRIEKYRGMTMPIDEGVGALRQLLVESGIAEKTLLLFFSDNGPSRDFPSGSEGLRGWKGDVYEGGHKVPAIAWWPGRIEAGSESSEPLMTIDVMPTLLALAGAEPPSRELDGIDFSPLLLSGEPLSQRPLFWASLSNQGRRAEAIRDGHWKLVVNHPGAAPRTFENPQLELYDLTVDPAETNNLAARYPERTAAMHGTITRWLTDVASTATSQQSDPGR